MVINLIYMFLIVVGIYFGVVAYLKTERWEIFLVLAIFLLSFYLEMDRMNRGSYTMDTNDLLWTIRDILWTFIMIFFFNHMKKFFTFHDAPSTNPKTRIKKIVKKK